MKVLKSTKKNIIITAQIVKNGGLVVFPTETVYGLGCDPLNVQAVKKIIRVKGERKKPFPVLAANIEEVERVAVISHKGRQLATKFWPGPLTMVFPKKTFLPDIVTFGLNSVGLRIPDSYVARNLISLSGGLLIGSSANVTKGKPPRCIEEISDELKDNVDIILDGGLAAHGKPSTVVDLTTDEPKILRKGPVTLKAILNALALND
jgi:L-threonylcarbamoyladenylate synthase